MRLDAIADKLFFFPSHSGFKQPRKTAVLLNVGSQFLAKCMERARKE